MTNSEMSRQATDLELFLQNYWNSYKHLQDCIDNLERKVQRGTYDNERALKIFKYPVETAAKQYAYLANGKREIGVTPWHKMFPVAVRREVEQSLFNEYREDYGMVERPCDNPA